MRDDRERLLDILEAIEAVERYSADGRARFDRDELVQVWVVHHIQVIGEAAAELSEATREMHPEVPWRQIVAMRNIVVHAYFRVDMDEVWGVVERDLPVLKPQITRILGR